ncbi:MAG: 30S ribosomal protein S3 [Candidatus Komeilibacteria bacterium RIFOXYC1_FULL_37_11]|uniref:Small ribosomal subunit protein uS3 n=1 Tax=Candidatus Komeilibacteria bacterium RIFOXYC1_FULL_37_11 TaxID=1798555 RepID=A0A1G2BYZ0_9BACT|nr:MAG: 30S ribosomal protein S3 [Candidatus Komeilibacteria bacterium RIFOXYC1_FULL_37_11]OGY95351.1 MAG: 30S ribosomal protein S3 [Candidatus Komeilibacteria bacterium RIFOXYD1_FULL_37_29]OGY97214.1 MAG: 30S ribosomal protein S3 [Candidatus Komeilibacteria bacterium RIFOXYD2_FULL_37_8]
MGKKVNPRVFRLGLSEKWRSRWYSGRDFSKFLQQDVCLRRGLNHELKEAGIDRIEIERNRGEIIVNILAAKPGIIIGRGGSGIEDLKKKIKSKYLDKDIKLSVNIREVAIPNQSANIIVDAVRVDLEKRIPFRRVLKQNVDKVMKAGAKGVKILVAGRLNGVDIARREKIVQGKIPLQTLRSNIDYSRGVAQTMYGVIGIKVWVYKGEYFTKKEEKEATKKLAPVKSAKLFSGDDMKRRPIEKPSTSRRETGTRVHPRAKTKK